MYLIRNSELMESKSKDMWAPIINILHSRSPPQVGFGMSIQCNQHSDYKHTIVKPDQFMVVSPNSKCFQQCDALLACEHTCKE